MIPLFCTAFGKNSIACFVWNTIPSTWRNKSFARKRIFLVGYSCAGSAITETTTLLCSPKLAVCAIKLFFPLQEKTRSGRMDLNILRSLWYLA